MKNKLTVVYNAGAIFAEPIIEDVNIDLFPIKNLTELNEIENKLYEKIFFNKILLRFKKEYENCKLHWKQIAYLFNDNLIERNVLTQYSWTGCSKLKTKLSFSALVNINRHFYNVIKSGDDNYTQINHEYFFKNCVLKYS